MHKVWIKYEKEENIINIFFKKKKKTKKKQKRKIQGILEMYFCAKELNEYFNIVIFYIH